LSEFEKNERRKFLNRQAAQHARDRSKLQMHHLEKIVTELRSENERLKQMNSELSQRCEVLSDLFQKKFGSGVVASSSGNTISEPLKQEESFNPNNFLIIDPQMRPDVISVEEPCESAELLHPQHGVLLSLLILLTTSVIIVSQKFRSRHQHLSHQQPSLFQILEGSNQSSFYRNQIWRGSLIHHQSCQQSLEKESVTFHNLCNQKYLPIQEVTHLPRIKSLIPQDQIMLILFHVFQLYHPLLIPYFSRKALG
jgi:hypothetical protein